MNNSNRLRRHKKIRRKVFGSSSRPRLSIFRSSQHIYAQIIDDVKGQTLVFLGDNKMTGSKLSKAYNVGKTLAGIAIKNKIIVVVFDRGGFLYKGRIAEIAKGAREGGLKF